MRPKRHQSAKPLSREEKERLSRLWARYKERGMLKAISRYFGLFENTLHAWHQAGKRERVQLALLEWYDTLVGDKNSTLIGDQNDDAAEHTGDVAADTNKN